MTTLDLFTPTSSRNLTYYDRCAIALLPEEMQAVRIRVTVDILASPLERSLNLKYPYSKEFYGYAQTFWQNTLLDEYPISYSSQIIIDYWNQHGTLAHQLVETFDRNGLSSASIVKFIIDTVPDYPFLSDLQEALTRFLEQSTCLKIDLPDFPAFVNTFILPFNLLRFKFAFGTVFNVGIDTWVMGVGDDSDLLPTPPNLEQPYDTDNPNGTPPDRSPGSNDPEQPYGANPPESSPLNPSLDPDDFSNAPEPEPPMLGIAVRAWRLPAIPGQQGAGVVVACADVASLQDVPGFAFATNEEDLGTSCVPQSPGGSADGTVLSGLYPGFIPGESTNATGPDCPMCTVE